MTHEERVLLEYKAFRRGAAKEALKTLVSLALLVAVSTYIYFISLPKKLTFTELVEENPSIYLQIVCERQGTNNCWLMAASAAASFRAGYQEKTEDVLEYVNSKHRVKEEGGDATHESLVYEFYGVDSTSASQIMSCEEVISVLKDGCPIYCVIATESFKTAHAVVICGYELNEGEIAYFIMDPFTTYVSAIEVDEQTGKFSFESNDVLYTNWVRYRY